MKVRKSQCMVVAIYLPHQVLVFDHAQVPARGLGDPLPRYQVTQHNRSRTNPDCSREQGKRERGGGGGGGVHTGSFKRKERANSDSASFLFTAQTRSHVPGCFWRGLGRLVTHVWGHMRILHGCKLPSKKYCLASEMWIPPSGVLGRVLAGTRARQ